MKILILVQSVIKDRYPELMEVQKQTWESVEHPNIRTLFYYPDPDFEGIRDKDLHIKGDIHWGYMFIQTMKAFRNVMNMEWDYIVKTDNSTYVNKDRLYTLLLNKPRTNFYGGTRVLKHPSTGKDFLWGEGLILSRDIVEYLVDLYILNPFKRMGVEDAHIGDILGEKVMWDDSLVIGDYYSTKEINSLTHIYRCRNNNGTKFDDDIKAMKWIFSKLTQSK